MDDCGLVDVGYSGNTFTWTNGRKAGSWTCKILDRVLYNEEWNNNMGATLVKDKARIGFDHNVSKLLDFAAMFLTGGTKLLGGGNARKLHLILDKEQNIDIADSEENRRELNRVNADYIKWTGIQDNVLHQTANIHWAEEGDYCTKYFFSSINPKRRKTTLHRIKNTEGTWTEGNEAIREAVIQHFQKLYTDSNQMPDFGVLYHIDKLITEEDNVKLDAYPK
ncbi:uncharacterized protein LOC132620039 [Lycium barbarum]|uniref:uncharacterized protein LOC132620039 n=1 Tax=Lycium barbarum TaxID=112863 RepID=UPI00293F61E8|nr:uncharacterized protein LOC132620039 [Lycium barbarum]